MDEEIMQAHSLSNKSGEPAGAVWLPCSGGSTISWGLFSASCLG